MFQIQFGHRLLIKGVGMKLSKHKWIILLSMLIFSGCSYLPVQTKTNQRAQQSSETQHKLLPTHARSTLQKTVIDQAERYVTTDAPHNQVYHFAFDKSHVKSKFVASLKAQAEYLVNHRDAHLRLEGHTDERGSREYNVALGMRRAKAVASVLKQHGVSSDQLTVVSYGQEKPADLGHNPQAYWQNRRVHLKYTDV
jgi:peptidoglycan-associated lipoprotein